MVGLLSQLSMLAVHSHDLFLNLTQEVTQVYQRTVKLSARVVVAEKNISIVEKMCSQMTVESFLGHGRVEFSLPPGANAQLFTAETLPATIQQRYGESFPPPPLHRMDPYMDEGKKCLELYTNPKFFLDEWIAEQIKQRQAAKEERKKRREERKVRKANEPKNRSQLGTAQPAKLQKVVYDPVTGEKIVTSSRSSEDVRNSPLQSTLKSTPSSSNLVGRGASASNFFVPPPPSSSSFDELPPPPPDEFFAPPPPPPDGFDVAPPPPPDDRETPPPPTAPPAFQINPQIKQTPILVQSRGERPSPAKETSASSPPPPPPLPRDNIPAAPPREVPSAPPPPSPNFGSPRFTPAPSGNLLNELQNKSLKPMQPAPPKTVDARSTLLEGIKTGIALRSAKERQLVQAPTKEGPPASVAEILSRRIAIQGSDSEDEEDGGWD